MATETRPDAALAEQIQQARRAGRRARQEEVRAAEANVSEGRLSVLLTNGASIVVPVALMEELRSASPVALAEVEIPPSGYGVHWPRLDVHVALSGILEAALGTALGTQWGRIAGRTKSEAKAAAARENGEKGGRPRKQPA